MGNIRILLQQKIRCLIERSTTLWRSALDLRITSQMRYFIHFPQVWQLKTLSRLFLWGASKWRLVVHFNCRYNIAPCLKIKSLPKSIVSDTTWFFRSTISNFSCSSWFQLPPLTPGTHAKVGEALKCTYSTWDEQSKKCSIPSDPKEWTADHIKEWLSWTKMEFQLSLSPDSINQLISDIKVGVFILIKSQS